MIVYVDKVSDFLSGGKAVSPNQSEDKSILSADIIETGLYKKETINFVIC